MERKQGIYEKYIKRLVDVVCSLSALIVLLPILLVLTVVGAIKMKGKPFFTQDRSGKDEKIFKLIKFRTMTCEKDENGNLLPDEVRLTKYGKMLRSTSLDELPELINILKGDMSIVGPRPLVEEYLPYYTEEEKHRHDIRPGLTGLAQVNGRNFITWEQIFAYDLQYVNRVTFINDCAIIWKTIGKVLFREDIADETEAKIGDDGKAHFEINGEDVALHQPLHIERRNKVYAERNRK